MQRLSSGIMDTREIIIAVMAVVFAYVCGSIPFGYIIGRIHGVDVRKEGSKNIGATNVTRCVGKRAGQLCFALDFIKGLVPVLAAEWVLGGGSLAAGQERVAVMFVVFAAIIGHIFPVFLNFRGGKGVSTAAGAIMALAPVPLCIGLVVWVVVFFVSRYVSLASICASAMVPVAQWILVLAYGRSQSVAVLLTVVAALAIFRHRSNITRLLNGTESRFGRK